VSRNARISASKHIYKVKQLQLIMPIHKNEKNRRPSQSLIDLSDWVRHYITEDELSTSQFKPRVSTRKKPADKPDHW